MYGWRIQGCLCITSQKVDGLVGVYENEYEYEKENERARDVPQE